MRTLVLCSRNNQVSQFGISAGAKAGPPPLVNPNYASPEANTGPTGLVTPGGVTVQTPMMDTHNLPNLEWHIWLDSVYEFFQQSDPPPLPGTLLRFFPQNNITFVPIMSDSSTWAGPTAVVAGPVTLSSYAARPICAPILLPIALPITVKRTAACTSMGVWFQLPITPTVNPASGTQGTVNRVHIVLSASA